MLQIEVLTAVPREAWKDSGDSPSHGPIDGSSTVCGEETWPEDRLLLIRVDDLTDWLWIWKEKHWKTGMKQSRGHEA